MSPETKPSPRRNAYHSASYFVSSGGDDLAGKFLFACEKSRTIISHWTVSHNFLAADLIAGEKSVSPAADSTADTSTSKLRRGAELGIILLGHDKGSQRHAALSQAYHAGT